MRMNRRFDSVASLREGVALNSAGAVAEQVCKPRIQLLVGHLPHADLGFELELVAVVARFHLRRPPFQRVYQKLVPLHFLGAFRLHCLPRHVKQLLDVRIGLVLSRARVLFRKLWMAAPPLE
jgi:hypothetical protein